MAKRSSSFDLPLPSRPPGEPLGRWLAAELRAEILAGRLSPGARLPGSRDLAERQGWARGTVVEVYEQLVAEGYLEAGVGSGTRVCRQLPAGGWRTEAGSPSGEGPAPCEPPALSRLGRRVRPFAGLTVRPTHAFRANLPDLSLFPRDLWARLTSRLLRHGPAGLWVGCEPMGHLPLRQALAEYLGAARGARVTAARIAIVSGMQEALDTVARLALDAGDRVALEEPGYEGAWRVFEAHGARISRVRVDREGLDPADPALAGARLVYTTPAHQFPTGVAMTLSRRLVLLSWAARTGALLFEDDYDGEFRYAGSPLPVLQGLDRHGGVFLCGTFGKLLFPSLRLGYVVVPEAWVDPFAALRSVVVRHPPLLEQAVLAEFLAAGHFGRHLRRMREVYGARHAALLAEVRRHLAGRLEMEPLAAGLQAMGRLAPGIDPDEAERAAAARGVEVVAVPATAHGPAGLQLGFSAVDEAEIRRGVRELAAILSSFSTRQT